MHDRSYQKPLKITMMKNLSISTIVLVFAIFVSCIQNDVPKHDPFENPMEIITKCFVNRALDRNLYEQSGILWNLKAVQSNLSQGASERVQKYLDVATQFKKNYSGLWQSIPRVSDAMLLLKSDPFTSCGSPPYTSSAKVKSQSACRILYEVTYELQGNATRFSQTIQVVMIRENDKWLIDNVFFPAGTFPMLEQKQDFCFALDWLSSEIDSSAKWGEENKGALETQDQILKRFKGEG